MIGQHLLDKPFIDKNRLLVGNLASPVAICALWKNLENVKFTEHDLHHISIAGNLYTMRGLSELLRGLWRVPTIRHLILWGPDIQDTGDALLSLWENGATDDHLIKAHNVPLDKALPLDAIDHLRQEVYVHDCRSIKDLGNLMTHLKGLQDLPPHGEPKLFPVLDPESPETLPSAISGWHISTPKVAHAWSRLLDLVLRFGYTKPSQYSSAQRELLNVMTVIFDEDPDDPYLPPFLSLTRPELDRYMELLLEDTNATDLSYTPGNRLRSYFKRDQLATITQQLRDVPYTRRAVGVMWDPVLDPDRSSPPCFTQIVMNIIDDKLFLTYTARSQDIFAAWVQDTLGMRILQSRIAKELGVGLGTLTNHTVSAHIYEYDWDKAKQIVAKRTAAHQAVRFDPQGNFIIRVEDAQIVVELIDPSGQQVLWRTCGTSSELIAKQIASMQLASMPDHYIYIGRELQKAEDMLRLGLSYDQGRA